MNRSRIRKLSLSLKKGEACYVSSPQNVFYLSGFAGTFGKILASRGRASLITDARYEGSLKRSGISSVFSPVIVKKFSHELRSLLKGFSKVYISIDTPLNEYLMLKKLRKQIIITDIIEKQRMIKDASELKLIKKAIKINEKAILHIVKSLKPGVSEYELATEFECFIKKHGAEKSSFSPIIAFNEHSAIPHHMPGPKKLTRGSLILIDCGVKYRGYCSDLTRVIAFGIIKSRLKNIRKNYEAVLKAKKAGSALFKNGVLAKNSDASARRELSGYGLEKFFTHSLGHSFGISVHEPPYAAAREKLRLKAGMVMTCEPGVYFSDEYGIRVEDDYLVTAKGCRKLSTLPDRLIIK